MTSLVADTHAAIWYYFGSPELSADALRAMDDAIQTGGWVVLSAISLVEVAYLVEKRRLPVGTYENLIAALEDAEFRLVLAPVSRDVCDALRRVPRSAVPDMPDRIIAATALNLGLPLVSRDTKNTASAIQTIW